MIGTFAIELNTRIRSLDDCKKSQEMESEKERARRKGAYFEVAGAKQR